MGVIIDKDTELDSIKQRIGVGENEELRTSHRRERYLEKYARIMSGDPSLGLQFTDQGAFVDLDGDTPQIHISARETEQPVTDYREDVWDLLRQETLTLHELGHVLYTDWPSFDSRRQSIEEAWQPCYKHQWNAFEDGAIEKQLRLEFSDTVAKAIHTTNANLSENTEFGQKKQKQNGKEVVIFTMHDAITAAAMCLGVYDNGALDQILDENDPDYGLATAHDEDLFRDFLPRIEQAVMDIQAEPDGKKRNELFHEFFKDAKDLMDRADVSGRRQAKNSEGGNEPMEGKPDDSEHDGMGEQQREALMLDEDAEGSGGGTGASSAGTDQEAPGQQPGGGGVGGDDGDEEDEGAGAGDDGDEDGDEDGEGGSGDNVDEELQESFQQEVVQEARAIEGGEQKMDEIEEFADIIKSAGPGQDFVQLEIPDPHSDFDVDRYNEAKRISRRIERILGSKLKREKRSRTKRNQRFGHVDQRRLMKSARGDMRVFRRETDGNDKDYNCMLVMDRSGSMGAELPDAEIAVGALADALENLGVDTSVVDFLGGRGRLAKPFGVDLDVEKEHVFCGQRGGGTPLTQTTFLARQRASRGENTQPFMIVVTDGEANNMQAYKKELNACNFPVLGVYLRNDMTRSNGGQQIQRIQSDVSQMFDRSVVVCKDDDLSQSLMSLVQEVMF